MAKVKANGKVSTEKISVILHLPPLDVFSEIDTVYREFVSSFHHKAFLYVVLFEFLIAIVTTTYAFTGVTSVEPIS